MFRFLLCKQQSAAAGFGLFGGGYATAYLSVTDKYIYNTDVVTPGTSLTNATAQHAACGNFDVGIFYAGVSASSYKYTYSNDTVAGGASPVPPYRRMLAACGDSTRGIFGGGLDPLNGNAELSSTQKYTYSSNTAIAGTSLGTARSSLAACGSQTFGVFSGGVSSSNTDKYTYSNDSVSPGTSLLDLRYDNAACGDSVRGLFSGGSRWSSPYTVSVTDKYTYSTNTVTAATSLSILRTSHRACGDAIRGIFGGGTRNGYLSGTEKYAYATDSVTAGTNLGTARYWLGACSSTPGHL